ncbi:unnamed protein product, partial [Penicillium discolor]
MRRVGRRRPSPTRESATHGGAHGLGAEAEQLRPLGEGTADGRGDGRGVGLGRESLDGGVDVVERGVRFEEEVPGEPEPRDPVVLDLEVDDDELAPRNLVFTVHGSSLRRALPPWSAAEHDHAFPGPDRRGVAVAGRGQGADELVGEGARRQVRPVEVEHGGPIRGGLVDGEEPEPVRLQPVRPVGEDRTQRSAPAAGDDAERQQSVAVEHPQLPPPEAEGLGAAEGDDRPRRSQFGAADAAVPGEGPESGHALDRRGFGDEP